MSKIILTADCQIEDTLLREYVDKLWRKVETLNERTKKHTIQIKELKKEIKEQ